MYHDERILLTDDEAKISYSVVGEYSNPTILMIHGWASDRSTYNNLIPELSKNFRLIIPDLRGFGKSEKKPPFVTHRMVKDMILLYKAENAKIILGHSWGGLIAQELSAVLDPQATILVSTFAKWSRPFSGWFFKLLLPIIERMDIDAFVNTMLEVAYRTRNKDMERSLREMLRNLDMNVLKESGIDILEFDSTPELSLIKSPALIVHGDRDHIVPLEHAFYLSDNIKNSEIVVIPRVGHNLPDIKPKLLSSLITGWVLSSI